MTKKDIIEQTKASNFFSLSQTCIQNKKTFNILGSTYLHWISSARFGPGTGEEGGAGVLPGALDLGLPINSFNLHPFIALQLLKWIMLLECWNSGMDRWLLAKLAKTFKLKIIAVAKKKNHLFGKPTLKGVSSTSWSPQTQEMVRGWQERNLSSSRRSGSSCSSTGARDL